MHRLLTLLMGAILALGLGAASTEAQQRPRNLFLDRVPAAIYVGNGFGKLLGSTQVAELARWRLLSCLPARSASGERLMPSSRTCSLPVDEVLEILRQHGALR